MLDTLPLSRVAVGKEEAKAALGAREGGAPVGHGGKELGPHTLMVRRGGGACGLEVGAVGRRWGCSAGGRGVVCGKSLVRVASCCCRAQGKQLN